MSEVRILSSMATRHLLSDLVAAFAAASPAPTVTVESMGGVEAARRVAAGEPFDVVVLALGALEKLATQGHLLPDHIVALAASPIAAAVRAGAPRPSIASEDDVKGAVLAARTVGYSTGPSGDYLVSLFERWGIADTLRGRIVQAPPGVPVGRLLTSGEVELGFQQLSELMSMAGVDVLGPLPPALQQMTTFAGAVTTTSAQPVEARSVLDFMASPDAAGIKRRHGMDPP